MFAEAYTQFRTSRVHASTSLTAQTSPLNSHYIRCFSPRLFFPWHQSRVQVDGFTDFVQQLFPQWLRENTRISLMSGMCGVLSPFCSLLHYVLEIYCPTFQKSRLPLWCATGISNHPAFALYRVIHTMFLFNLKWTLSVTLWRSELRHYETKVREGWNELFTGSQSVNSGFLRKEVSRTVTALTSSIQIPVDFWCG